MLLAVLLLAAATPTPTPAAPRLTQEVLVQALRADDAMPVTTTHLDRAAIEGTHHGQEMPFLLGRTPSITFQSDSGIGAGYSYFSLRGIAQTRVNMTFDGVPLNDPEDSGVYFSNVGDFASALDSVQIQRGVSTSSVGAAAYGGAILFESLSPAESPAFDATLGLGSFASRRASLGGHSGRLRSGPALWGRASFLETDGYRDHSGVRQRSLFFGGNTYAGRWLLALSGFVGHEDAELAFLATEQSILAHTPRSNPLDEREVDRFRQDLVQVQAARPIGGSTLVAQVYSNGVAGWYRLRADPAAPDDLQQFGVDGRMLGARSSFTVSRRALTMTAGLHTGAFSRDHTLDALGERRYRNTGHKAETNGFLKLVHARGRWRVDLEAQLRRTRFAYDGDIAITPFAWTFLNARLGARRTVGDRASLYVSAGRVAREPTRNDLFAGEDHPTTAYDLRGVRPERVRGVELGTDYRSPRVEAQVNLYAMEFTDEIALTGELSPIGLLRRRNVDRSLRRGLEADVAWQVQPYVRLGLAGHWSGSRIAQWVQFYDVFEDGGAFSGRSSRTYLDVQPLLSPSLTVNLSAEWKPSARLRASILGRYVSRGFLDNTGQAWLRTPPYFDLGGTFEVEVARRALGRPRLRLVAQNLLDRRLWPAGYSASALVRSASGTERIDGTAFYYPLASRSVIALLSFHGGR